MGKSAAHLRHVHANVTPTLLDHDDREVKNTPAGDVALCPCGASKNKPYCDGSHAAAGFDGTLVN